MTHESDMSDVDASGTADRYLELLARVRGQLDEHKRILREMLAVGPGEAVLDVGCGPGDDAIWLAEQVGESGRVVAVDRSADLLGEARKKAVEAGAVVDLRAGDAQALDLPDASFDAVRAERLFQHLPDPDAALAEMVRVLRPGGRALVCDADYDAMVLDSTDPELTSAVISARADVPASGRIGRRLHGMMAALDLVDIRVRGLTFFLTDQGLGDQIFELSALARGLIEVRGNFDGARVSDWIADLERRGREDRYFVASFGLAVLGHKAP